MFGFGKKKIEQTKVNFAASNVVTPKGTIAPASGYISELNELRNSLISYDSNNFTDIQADLVFANPYVKSKLGLKLNKALAFNGAFDYNGVKKSVSNAIDKFMADLKWRDFARQIMYSRVYGKAVIRVYWDDNGNITETVGLNHALFMYNNDLSRGDIGDLMYNSINLTKKYPYNFMVIYNEPDAKHPFGQSDLKELYPTIMFYNFLRQVEARYFNKAVIPAHVAGYDSTLTGEAAVEEAERIGNVLSQIENSSGVGIANLKTLYTLQENGQINFNSTFERLTNTIAISILGSDLTDSKKNGTYAQAKVGSEYVEGNVKDLAVEIQNASNMLIEWQTWAWFGTEYVAPRFLYDMQEPYTLDKFEFMVANGFAISFKEASKVFPIPAFMVTPEDDVWMPTMITEKPNANEVVEEVPADSEEESSEDDKQN